MTVAGRGWRARLIASWPAAVIVLGIAVLAVYAFRSVLEPRPDRVPGVDAGIFYVWEVHTRAAFAAGFWPHWNPFFWGGTLHYADTLTAAVYPPALLLRWLEPASFLRWMIVLHLVISGGGTLFLARIIGLGWLSATAAAMALTIGGAAGGSINNGAIPIIYCVAWMPWALAFAILSVRRGTLLPHPGLPLVLLVQFMGGYLQGSIYLAVAVSLYYLFQLRGLIRHHRNRRGGRPSFSW